MEERSPQRDKESPSSETNITSDESLLDVSPQELQQMSVDLQADLDKLSKTNAELQNKIARKIRNKPDYETSTEDVCDREDYRRCLDIIENLKLQHHQVMELHQQRMKELHQQTQGKQTEVAKELKSFAALKLEVATTALTGKVGMQEALAMIDKLLADEKKLEEELAMVHLNIIKFKNHADLNTVPQSFCEEDLLLMDYEKVTSENQSLKDKLNKGKDELQKIERKISSTVQPISHMKEKLHFIQMKNKIQRNQLAEVDATVALKRGQLTHTRQTRDHLVAENHKLEKRCGLLGKNVLLVDYEEKINTSEALQQRLERLKREYAEIVLKNAVLKQKIERRKEEQLEH